MSVVVDAVLASLSAMAKIAIVFVVVIYAAANNYLSVDFLRLISQFSFQFLTPCLVLANLSRKVSWELLGTYWAVVIWAMFNILSSYAVGVVLTKVTKVRKEFTPTIVSAMAYSNSLNIPLVVFDSLALSSFFIDNTDAYAMAASFFFVYGIGWNILMYTYGYVYLLGESSLPTAPAVAATTTPSSSTIAALPNGSTTAAPTSSTPSLSITNTTAGPDDTVGMVSLPPAVAFLTLLCSRLSTAYTTCMAVMTSWMRWPACFSPRARFAIRAMVTNPMMIAQIAALIIGLTPALKEQCFSPGTWLRPFMQAVEFLASAAIPLGTVITAGNVYHSIVRNYGADARKLQFAIESAEAQMDTHSQAQEAGQMHIHTHTQSVDYEKVRDKKAQTGFDAGVGVEGVGGVGVGGVGGGRVPRAEEADQDLAALGTPTLYISPSPPSLRSIRDPHNTQHTHSMSANGVALGRSSSGDGYHYSDGHGDGPQLYNAHNTRAQPSGRDTRFALTPYGVAGAPVPHGHTTTTSISTSISTSASIATSVSALPGTSAPWSAAATSRTDSAQKGPADYYSGGLGGPVELRAASAYDNSSGSGSGDADVAGGHGYGYGYGYGYEGDEMHVEDNGYEGVGSTLSLSPPSSLSSLSLSTYTSTSQDTAPHLRARVPMHPRSFSPLPTLNSIALTPSIYNPAPNTMAVPNVPKITVEYGPDGRPLPLPRLSMMQMTLMSLLRLIVCPVLTFTALQLADMTHLAFMTGDFHFKVCLMLAAMSPSAEAVLMIITKAQKTRPSLALSLVYVMQYLFCLFTIPLGLTLVISIYVDD